MAVFTVSDASLRSLKNALKDRLPAVKSSHMSEALAYALGFNTNIALVNQLAKSSAGWVAAVDEQRFLARLVQLGYPEAPQLPFDVLIPNAGMPLEFLRLLTELSRLQGRLGVDNHVVYALQDQCKTAFANYWNLGRPDPIDDNTGVVARLERGVDHSACHPGWGEVVRSLGLEMRFPGTDHQVRFYERLPLSDGRYVEYSTALVSMPYLAASDNIRQIPKAEAIAEALGWECILLPQWTWYVPFSPQPASNATTLVLFRRKEKHEDTLRAWKTSLKRWAIENEDRLDRAGNPFRDAALGEVIESPHFPLTVTSFDDLRRRYLNEYVMTGYQWRDGVILQGMEELFAIWMSEPGR